MGAEFAFMVLRFCGILCLFLIHRSAGHAMDDLVSTAFTPTFRNKRHGVPVMHGFRRSIVATRPTSAPSKLPFQHPVRAHTKFLAPPPPSSYHKHHHRHYAKNQFGESGVGPSYPLPPPPYRQQISPFQTPYSSTTSQSSHVPAPSAIVSQVPVHPPSISPLSSPTKMTPAPSLTLILPPPPPNQDCTAITCTEPFTSTPSGFPCGCVRPIQVRLRFNIALYTFFPLLSKLAGQIATSLSLHQSQVRIMGANAATQQLQRTIVLVNLVPFEAKFKYTAAFSAYEKFWHRKIQINSSLFGAYDVIDVQYPGLPPSPPSLASNLATMDDHPYPSNSKDNGGSLLKPLGVDISGKQKNGLDGRVLATIVISSVTAFVICAGIAWISIVRCGCSPPQLEAPITPVSSFTKPSGASRSLALGSKTLSGSLSFASGIINFTGTAKVFTLDELERATNGFDVSRVLGEGGFGIVYKGTFDAGEQVAVKVLKRENRHGVREFLSEVEMLSRLHHRNLVKLIGICTEENIRCLVYELLPNGSVDFHLHGVDEEVAPLDWTTRMKIALGAARGLAYLHEDSSPCVIHRDFKSSNILLEHDFTPKVSDFGLARTALNEGNQPISTHVIGTFGYLAPEYAMTGHVLVKSDVYSYGVVLLELLTGRKPVDFSKPPGQENLVAWAHPLLTSNEGHETIMDPTLKPTAPYESFSKVAAIASMCVQPEVSRRPLMGEVVQALKLVCTEFDVAKEEDQTGSFNQEEAFVEEDCESSRVSGEILELSGIQCSRFGYESGSEAKTALSSTDVVSVSEEFKEHEYPSLRRHYSSGPLGLGRKREFWHRLGRFSRGSMRERLWPGSN